MTNTVRTLYPITIDIKVGITDGTTRGDATYSFSPFEIPTEGDIGKVLDVVVESLPEDFRLMTRQEHYYHVAWDKIGVEERFAIPALKEGERWFDPDTEKTPCDWRRVSDEEEL